MIYLLVSPGWARRSNVEVTGAARPYRAASAWTAGLGSGAQETDAVKSRCWWDGKELASTPEDIVLDMLSTLKTVPEVTVGCPFHYGLRPRELDGRRTNLGDVIVKITNQECA